MDRRTLLVGGTALVAAAAGAAIGAVASDDAPARPAADSPVTAAPRSVILLIGDGMDDSMITAARNYSVGAAGRLALDGLPATGAMTTYGLATGPGPEYPVVYVSDSAATASGFSTGHKTVDGRISQGPSSAQDVPGEDHETVLETFARLGRRTGNVSTADITDATAAAAAAHVNARSCQDPTTMDACPSARKSAGGRGSIAEQLVDNEVDVLLGGGSARWDRLLEDGSQTLLDYAASAHGYRTVGTADDLDAVDDLADGPVLGLFAPNHLTRSYAPLVATRGGASTPDGRCTPQDRGTEPTLRQLTAKAIELLDNPDGFFLQVEGASVDKAEHERDICGAIGELEELDQAVEVALAHQRAHPDTLVIVTGDHAHSTQIVTNDEGGRRTATVVTADGAPMTVAYSSAEGGDPGRSSHTGAQVRVAAVGPQADRVTGVIDQTDLFALMTSGLDTGGE
ncbi:alkaline phosphatase [Nocardioides sp. S5]|uniref:alkaline phosphatase n=1 Tax=Nocardioides sp. S5 TaxID=2017486 RepID=UPI001A8EEF8C|nr:alkaline phosphatase [Nocardioides sp. S5]